MVKYGEFTSSIAKKLVDIVGPEYYSDMTGREDSVLKRLHTFYMSPGCCCSSDNRGTGLCDTQVSE